jgi:hypothetical protein
LHNNVHVQEGLINNVGMIKEWVCVGIFCSMLFLIQDFLMGFAKNTIFDEIRSETINSTFDAQKH